MSEAIRTRDRYAEFLVLLDAEQAAFQVMQAAYFDAMPHLKRATAIGADMCLRSEKAAADWRTQGEGSNDQISG
jgi:hypothetical protein